MAAAFRDRFRLQPGSRVALAMTNRPEFFQTLFAAWHAGLCAVPVNARLHRREFQYILDQSGAEVCFTSPDLTDTLAGLSSEVESLRAVISTDEPLFAACSEGPEAALEQVAGEAPAWIFYTSGTTGRPKGATLSHRNLAFMTHAYYADIDQIDTADTMLHPAPLSHGSGLYALPHIARGSHQVIPESTHFEPAEIASLIHHYGNVSFFAPPTMLNRLVSHVASDGPALTSLKTIVYGGGPMYVPDLTKALETLGPSLVQIYGQGETPMTLTALSKAAHFIDGRIAGAARLSSCGVARTLVRVRTVDEQDRDVPPGEIGEVVTRSDCVMSGYWRAPAESAEALRNGWLHTGDLGTFDRSGYLFLKDRSTDMIITGAANVYPREVEEILLLHPAVEEASVVGRPHPDWVEEIVAFIVARPGQEVTAQELDRLCLENVARFKRPRAYFFRESLPKNSYGKVLKTKLREIAAGTSAAPDRLL